MPNYTTEMDWHIEYQKRSTVQGNGNIDVASDAGAKTMMLVPKQIKTYILNFS